MDYSKKAYDEAIAAKDEAMAAKDAAIRSENAIKEFLKNYTTRQRWAAIVLFGRTLHQLSKFYFNVENSSLMYAGIKNEVTLMILK